MKDKIKGFALGVLVTTLVALALFVWVIFKPA